MRKLEELQMGPILFREEAIFKREIIFEDVITIDVQLVRSRRDFARWSLRHNFKKADGTLAAIINIDGAWIDLVKRKLAIPDPFIIHVFEKFPKADDFEFLER
jgi:acyl-CoA thioester hydrolase